MNKSEGPTVTVSGTVPVTVTIPTDILSDTFLGSGATSYPWYGDQTDGPEWSVAVGYPGEGVPFVNIGAAEIVTALVKIVANGYPGGVYGETLENAQLLVFSYVMGSDYVADMVDFDANSADTVMQLAAFGDVLFG